MPTISIIVPVYKVERYLDRCVESIISQTFTELEIILVDDGSPDRSGVMCDEWARKDKRIRVFHKKNGGLSDARNYGLEVATGEYLAFIDSDDWIDNDMMQILYDAIQTYGADIAECSWRCIYQDRIEEETENTGEYITGNNIFALHGEIQWKYFKSIACNKLYKKEVFRNVRFPVGKLHEDEYTTHLAFYNARRLVYVDLSKYNYDRTREDSITASFCEKNLDVIDALQSRLDFFYEKGLVEVQQEMENLYFNILLDRLYKCYVYKIHTERVKRLIRDTNEKYFLNMELPISKDYKYELSLLKNSYYLFGMCKKHRWMDSLVHKMKYIFWGQKCIE
ncbi:MAG: glycosyltransferase family 2 protein [Lachnospirales bacterium]